MPTEKSRAGVLLFTFLLAFLALPASGQNSQSLPDAPNPGLRPAHTSHESSYSVSRRYGVVDPGETPPILSGRDKMLFWLHEETNPVGWFPGVLSSGFAQWTNSDPKYGTDSAAFGQRLGATIMRDTSMRFFSDSLLPTLTHEDPRYYRKAYGGIRARGLYAASRVFITRRDSGVPGFNYSDTLGHLAASALTPAYYPAPSANGRVVVTTWALSLAGDAGGNLFLEFWPDVRDAIFHHHHHHASNQP